MKDAVAHAAFIARSLRGLLDVIRLGTLASVLAFSLSYPLLTPVLSRAAEPASTSESSAKTFFYEKGETGKSVLLPALEIPAFILLLNALDRHLYYNEIEEGEKEYGSTLSTTLENLAHGRWGLDDDNFRMNQFLHPY